MNGKISAGEIVAVLKQIRQRKIRVQCLTNTVAQNITANVLLAAGADASMAVHPQEILAMSESADGLLINLGTPDAQRGAAIEELLPHMPRWALPVVLDPVFIHASPLRRAWAGKILSVPNLIVRGSEKEMAAMPQRAPQSAHTYVTTGPHDFIMGPDDAYTVTRGHPLLAQVTGTGCAVGALIAAFAAIETRPARAAAMALTYFGAAAEWAAEKSGGPGTFAAHLLDALAAMDEAALAGK